MKFEKALKILSSRWFVFLFVGIAAGASLYVGRVREKSAIEKESTLLSVDSLFGSLYSSVNDKDLSESFLASHRKAILRTILPQVPEEVLKRNRKEIQNKLAELEKVYEKIGSSSPSEKNQLEEKKRSLKSEIENRLALKKFIRSGSVVVEGAPTLSPKVLATAREVQNVNRKNKERISRLKISPSKVELHIEGGRLFNAKGSLLSRKKIKDIEDIYSEFRQVGKEALVTFFEPTGGHWTSKEMKKNDEKSFHLKWYVLKKIATEAKRVEFLKKTETHQDYDSQLGMTITFNQSKKN